MCSLGRAVTLNNTPREPRHGAVALPLGDIRSRLYKTSIFGDGQNTLYCKLAVMPNNIICRVTENEPCCIGSVGIKERMVRKDKLF